MPLVTINYRCQICDRSFATTGEAEACESQGLLLPFHRINDKIRFKGMPGNPHADFEGTVKDIIFPLPWATKQGGEVTSLRSIGHKWEVKYLVGVANRDMSLVGMPKELLCIVDSYDVRPKEGAFMYPLGEFDPSQRRFAESWEDFCDKVKAQNPPHIVERLAQFTNLLKSKTTQ